MVAQPIFSELNAGQAWPRYWATLALEFGLLAGCGILLTQGSYRRFLIALAIILALIPLYKIGIWHDMSFRAPLPAFFLLWCIVLNSCLHQPSGKQSPGKRARKQQPKRQYIVAAVYLMIAIGTVGHPI